MTDLDNQIAAVEREIIDLQRKMIGTGGTVRSRLRKQLATLQGEHELLVRQVQWATVGAAKPGEVL